LESNTQKITAFDKNSPFKKRSTKLKWVFIGAGILLALVFFGVLVSAVINAK
jgi:hypothetical protein